MYLHLDYQSGEPIYRQIVEQIKFKVACGRLGPMDQLPSIRDLAEQLKINPRTVVKAYEELQSAGLAVRRQGQGVFITENHGALPTHVRRGTIADMVKRLLAETSRLGADADEVREILDEVAQKMGAEK
jgi:GntR family transcriptional regulator